MKINNIRNILENAHVIQTEETYSQFAGLEFNPTIIEEVSVKNSRMSIIMKAFDSPRELFLSALEILAEDKTKELEQKLHETRNAKVIDQRYKIEGNYVNWSNWRQFSAVENNYINRKNVFDCFIEKTATLKPIIEDRFTKISEIYESEGKINPLDGYLESEKVNHEYLVEFIEDLTNHTKKIFNERFIAISKTMLGRNPEYFDDFYYLGIKFIRKYHMNLRE